MRPKLFFQGTGLAFIITLFFFSCKKETQDESNQSPLARAGIDRFITLPKDSIHLNGNSSIDLDGTITTYKWEKISSPSSLVIVNADAVQTAVTGLQEGVYSFQLSITDNNGAGAKDI